MKLLFALLAVAVLASHSEKEYRTAWSAWKNRHARNFLEKEDEYRFGVFRSNMDFVEDFNSGGRHSYTLALNEFSDLTHAEFLARYLSPISGSERNSNGPCSTHGEPWVDSADWNAKGVVCPVKDQGQCGSCWAFAAIGALESAWAIKTGHLVCLSEQNLIDCSGSHGTRGCNGGFMTQAYDYILDAGGIDSADCYPYRGRDQPCAYQPSCSVGPMKGMCNITSGDEHDLMGTVATAGPVAVAIDASHMSFQFYHSGIYDEPSCSTRALNHAVLATGYGSTGGRNYWIVKNSWGRGWGQSGYLWIAKDKGNMCGIATMATIPLV